MISPSGELWLEADALFQEALERPAAERLAFLEEVCGNDSELRAAVVELLRIERESGDFLARPLDELTSVPWDDVLTETSRLRGSGTGSKVDADRSGERIGAYLLVRRLGRGGMATVYLAERADGLWEQRVALKLIRRGLDTEDVVRRFLSERQILSSLDHPNVARLLDGGTTRSGLPYLVMEYVEGTPITEYCDEGCLSIAERLRLFCDVGRAVQHAHQSLVVHRDLKPSNILVTDDGRVKLLDFGIAKILDPSEDALRTRTGRRPFTPEYASPEQLTADAITTASDVYQLGILLGELVSGTRPIGPGDEDAVGNTRRTFFDAGEPIRPSSLVTREAAACRSTGPKRLARRLRGDLDTIVLRALPREPERRYESAGAMVADVERHVAGRPITARPATLSYRVRKLVRRRPWLLATVAAALIAIAGYFFTVVHHSSEMERERNVARTEAARAAEVQQFLVDVFRSVDPYADDLEPDRDITVREALGLGADRVRTELEGRPALQSNLLGAIGDVYANLDLIDSARELREEALVLQRDVHGDTSAETALALRKLGAIAARQGRHDSATALLRRSLALTRDVHGPRDSAVAGVLTTMGELASERGRYEAAEEYLMTAVDLLQEHEPRPTAQLAAAYTELSRVHLVNDRMLEARTAAEEAVRLHRLVHGDEHPRTAIALHELADLHDLEDRRGDALSAYREAIAILDRTLGAAHERTVDARRDLALALLELDDLTGAEAVHRKMLAVWRSNPEAVNVPLADALEILGVAFRERGVPFHTVVVDGNSAPGWRTRYRLRASGRIQQVEGQIDGRSVTVNPNDVVADSSAVGVVGSASDGFYVFGDVVEIELQDPAAATIYVDGVERSAGRISSGERGNE